VDIDYGADDAASGGAAALSAPLPAGSRSRLHPAIQQLIRIIFDVDSIKKVSGGRRAHGRAR